MTEFLMAKKSDVENLGKADIGLSQVVNALQVINGGNVPRVVRDDIANRPAADGTQGLYIAQDESRVYADFGSWNEIGTAAANVTKANVGLGSVLNKAQLAKDGSEAATGNLPMGGFKITGLADPAAAGDAVTRRILGSSSAGEGAALLAYENGLTAQQAFPAIPADNVKALVDATFLQIDGLQAQLRAFYSDTDTGGGHFYFDENRDKADANGGTIIDPDNVGTLSDTALGTLLTEQGTGSGSGCWVRLNPVPWHLSYFGIIESNSSAKNTEAIKSLINAIPRGYSVACEPGQYKFDGFELDKQVSFFNVNEGAPFWGEAGTSGASNPLNDVVFLVGNPVTTDVKVMDPATGRPDTDSAADDDVAGIWIRGSSTDTGIALDRLAKISFQDIAVEYSATPGQEDEAAGAAILVDDAIWSRFIRPRIITYGDHCVRLVNHSWQTEFNSGFYRGYKPGAAANSPGNPNSTRLISHEHVGNGVHYSGINKFSSSKDNVTNVFVSGNAADAFKVDYADIGSRFGGCGIHVYNTDDIPPSLFGLTWELAGGAAIIVESSVAGEFSSVECFGGRITGIDFAGASDSVIFRRARRCNFFGTEIGRANTANKLNVDSNSRDNTFWNCMSLLVGDDFVVDNGSNTQIINLNQSPNLGQVSGWATKNPGISTSHSLDIGTGSTFGSETEITPDAGFLQLLLRQGLIDVSGMSSENIDVRIAMKFSGGATKVEIVSFTGDDAVNLPASALIKTVADGLYLTAIGLQAQTDAGSTGASVQVDLAINQG